MEKKSLFRKKSLEQIESPEQLDEYMHIINPSIVMILASILIILAGVVCFSVFGQVKIQEKGCLVVEDTQSTMFVPSTSIDEIQKGMEVTVAGKKGTVTEVDPSPLKLAQQDDQVQYYLDEQAGKWCCRVLVSMGQETMNKGVYEAYIETKSVKPVYFILN